MSRVGSRRRVTLIGAGFIALGMLIVAPAALATHSATDIDGDRVANTSDNCPDIYNRPQDDNDQDGIGNLCDTFPVTTGTRDGHVFYFTDAAGEAVLSEVCFTYTVTMADDGSHPGGTDIATCRTDGRVFSFQSFSTEGESAFTIDVSCPDGGGYSAASTQGQFNQPPVMVTTACQVVTPPGGGGGGGGEETFPDASFEILGEGGRILSFDASGSSDPDGGQIVSYAWEFGDSSTSTGPQVSHPYSVGAEYIVTLTVTDDEGETNIATERALSFPPEAYAPTLWFHPDEEFWPMDPAEFVAHSSLNWAHDGLCDDEVVVRKRVSASKLGSGGYAARENAGGTNRCRPYGPRYRSNQYTRPFDDPAATNKANTEVEEGFYLDLEGNSMDPGYHVGNAGPSAGFYLNGPRVYYSYLPGRYVVYWFFYGFNSPTAYGGASGLIDDHEGEWERLAVRLDDEGNAREVAYYSHYCDPSEKGLLFTFQEAQNNGYIVAEGPTLGNTHPIVYVSNGSHASYPTAGEHSPTCNDQGFAEHDQTSADGATWDLRGSDVADITSQAWYGYGGAWGDTAPPGAVGIRDLRTGPLGPPHKDPVEFLPW